MGAIFAMPVARDVAGPGERIALVAHDGERLRGRAEGDVTVLIGAERDGLPGGCGRGRRPGGAHPDPTATR